MSQTAQSKPGQGRPGQNRPVQYGGGRPGAAKPGQSGRRPRREPVEEIWVPKTTLGQKVNSGEITSIEEILEAGLRIQEAGIIKKLLPDLKSEVVDVGIIQKMTSNGQSTRFKAIVATGNENGYLGIGQGKSKQMRIAIEKATSQSLINVEPLAVVHASFNPANSNNLLIFPPATNPNPLGAGMISIVTLPPFPRILKGTECF